MRDGMDVTCVTDIFKFMHRVMNLEVDEIEYCDDESYDMPTDEEVSPLYEDNEG